MFALWIGASVTAALLAVPAVGASRGGRLAGALTALALSAAVVVGVAYAERGARPGPVGAGVALALCALALALPRARRAVASVPLGWRVGANALRLAGALRLVAMNGGWLPPRFAWLAAGLDVLVAVSAVALALKPTWTARRAVRGAFALAALASLGVEAFAQSVWVMPLPGFESLWLVTLAPIYAAAGAWTLPVAQGADADAEPDQGGASEGA